MFAPLNLGAATARVVWGIVADRAGGSRRVAHAVGARPVRRGDRSMPFPFALHAGLVSARTSARPLAFGMLGLQRHRVRDRRRGGRPLRAGVAVGAASTVVFLMGSITPPRSAALRGEDAASA